MMKEARRAMAPWMGGQPLYGPMSSAPSQMNPLLYAGKHTNITPHKKSVNKPTAAPSSSAIFMFLSPDYFCECVCPPGSASGKSIPLKPMPLPPPQSSAYSMPTPSAHGTHTPANTNHMLDYLENQVRGMDMTSPLLQVCNCQQSPIFVFLSYHLHVSRCF